MVVDAGLTETWVEGSARTVDVMVTEPENPSKLTNVTLTETEEFGATPGELGLAISSVRLVDGYRK